MNIWKWILSVVVAILLIAVVVVPIGCVKKEQGEAIGAFFNNPQPPTFVHIGMPLSQDWEVGIPAVGTVTSVEGIIVRPETSGIIEKILFQPGAEVTAGDILVELEKAEQAANLAQAEADLGLAKKSLKRATDLFASRSVPESDLDAAQAQTKSAEARVRSLKATLAKKTIRAPFTGRLGIKNVSIGQYLNPGDPIVVLQSIDPVFVEFSLPQRELSRLGNDYEVRATIDAYPDNSFNGTISAISPEIDRTTRNVSIQATFGSSDGLLRPGMFANVNVIMPATRAVIIVPIMAVVYNPAGNRIYLAEENEEGTLVARQTLVRLGQTKGDYIEILDGLEGTEQIVLDGAFKLRDGVPIAPDDRGTIEAQLEPTPENT